MFFQVNPKDVSPRLAIKKSDVPILLIHGDKDSQIPVENSRMIKKTNPSLELLIFPDADHGQSHALYEKEYEDAILSFLSKNMK